MVGTSNHQSVPEMASDPGRLMVCNDTSDPRLFPKSWNEVITWLVVAQTGYTLWLFNINLEIMAHLKICVDTVTWLCFIATFFFPWMKRKGSYMFSVKSVHWTGGKVSRVQFRFTSSLWNRLEHGTGQESCWGSISKNQMFIICCLMFVDELPIARMDVLFFATATPMTWPEESWSRMKLDLAICIYSCVYILYSDSNYYHSYSSYYY